MDDRIVYEKFADDIDFYELFKKIERRFGNCFFFESLGEERRFSRYSVIGFDPLHVISGRGNTLVFDNKVFSVANPYDALREIMPQKIVSKAYAGGLVGYVGYDAVNYFEPSISVKTHEHFDPFMFGVYVDGLILDRATNEIFYFYYGESRRNEIENLLKSPPIKDRGFTTTLLRDSTTKQEYMDNVSRVKEEILSGNTFQCEVGFKNEFEIHGDKLSIYSRLREVNPSPFMYYLKFNEKLIIGASPELHLSLIDGELETHPTAGTIRRGKTESEDQQLARELMNNRKEIAEHSMLVDLYRNDLGRVAHFGTVRARELMNVKRFSHVQHILSQIIGFIQPGIDMFTAFALCFPGGTVTGTPKIETMKIINKNESGGRGPYGGAVGWFGFGGDFTFGLTIRSLYLAGTYAYAQTSSGVVYDSEPEKEYEEIQHKFAAMKKVLGV